MKLTRLTLKNFRCFDDLEIDFHEQLTVLIAPNGAGKTSVLDAARIALSAFIRGIDVSSARPHVLAKITREDVRQVWASTNMQPQLPSSVTAEGEWQAGQSRSWQVWRESVAPKTQMRADTNANELTRYATDLQTRARSPEASNSTELPLLTYLGTGRLWFQGRYTKRPAETSDDASGMDETASDETETELDTDSEPDMQMYERIWGYENCLVATSSFKQFHEWFLWLFKSYQELQLLQVEQPSDTNAADLAVLKASVDAVQQAINEVLAGTTGWKNLQYRRSAKALVMHHETHGYMPLKLLSDGVRNTIAMVADIAFRCVRLNPQFGKDAALKTRGVVLIDEVDMFLHPSWQQQVIGSLQRAFPRLQFIVTTHSPQVLTTVHRESIRKLIIHPDGRASAQIPPMNSYGMESQNTLYGIMDVDPQPPVAEKADLEKLTETIESGRYSYPKAKELLESLAEKLGDKHPQIIRLNRSLRRMEALKR
jgi:predicted ATP-binding protein involved in virulence